MDTEDKKSLFIKLKNYLIRNRKKDAIQEIQEIIDGVEEKGIIDEEQGDMIENIIILNDTLVREIMVPKMDMVTVEVSRPISEVVKAITKSGYSTIPVYNGTVDNIVGVVHAKDILIHMDQCFGEINIASIMRKPYFVPESKKLNDLLKDFKQRKLKIAFVIDEYGSLDGLTTLEDILNEVFETESPEDDIQEKGDGVFAVDPRMSVDEFKEEFAVEIPEGGYDTVAGFIISKLERIPQKGEIFEYDRMVFEIEEASKKRISKLIVRVHQEKAV